MHRSILRLAIATSISFGLAACDDKGAETKKEETKSKTETKSDGKTETKTETKTEEKKEGGW